MCRFLLFLLPPILTTFAINASVDVPPALIQNYTIADYKASGQNWSLAISPDGILYVGNNVGLLTFDGNTWTTYNSPDESIIYNVVLSNDTVFTRSETSIGYWLTNEMGNLDYYPLTEKPAHIHFKKRPQDPPFPLSDEIIQQKPSAFTSIDQFNFVGTLANGIYVVDENGNPLLQIGTRVGLQDNIVHDLYVQKTGHIWAAFDNGLSKVIFNSPVRLLATRSRVGKLTDIVFHNETLYIRTNTNYYKRTLGTAQFAYPVSEEEALPLFNGKEKKKKITPREIAGDNKELKPLLAADHVYPVSGSLYWFTKGNEASLVSIEGGKAHLKCRILFSNYNLNLVYRGEQIFPINDSLHIASTMQGVVLIHSNSMITNQEYTGLPLRFTKIEYTDGKGTHYINPSSKAISLPHDFYGLNVYAGSSILNMNNQISYKIEELSLDWSDWQREGKIDLLQLPQGEYLLKIRNYTSIGDYPEITLEIEVRPPWFLTIQAIISYIILIGLIIYFSIWKYLDIQKKKEKYLRQKEEQKMQQLKNEMLEAELQNKKNDLMMQTSNLIEKGLVISKLLDELEHQKEVMGKNYPDKLYRRMRSLMEEKLNNQSDWQAFESYFNSAHQNFIERFRQTYNDITPSDLRLCCLIRMNLSTKEIASILNISIRGVELRRYRLRKRIGLDSDTNLSDFLMNF